MDEATRGVTVVLFDGFELLDAFGPVGLFSKAPGIRVEFAGPEVGPVASSQGVEVLVSLAHQDVRAADLLLVPGGAGTRPLSQDQDFLAWLRRVGEASGLVASVCTGSALLAAAGLLDGRLATSNKRAFAWAASCGPQVEWVARARWVEDGDRWTSSGVAAGMDMAAALLERLCGCDVARAVTERVEYEPRRDAGDDPFATLYGLA